MSHKILLISDLPGYGLCKKLIVLNKNNKDKFKEISIEAWLHEM